MAEASSSHAPPEPPQAVAVLLLIENSRGLFHLWSDLRDQCLRPLLQKIEEGHPLLPMTTFVLESLPPNSAQSRKPIVPRQYRTSYDGLQDVRFNHNASNRLSLSKIRNGVEHLANAVTGAVSKHIVILASSPPLNDAPPVNDEEIPRPPPWYPLAELLAKVDARCHLIFKSGQDMQLLTGLFEEMLELQKITEESPWFPVDPNKITVRLSSQRDLRGMYGVAPYPTSPLQSSSPFDYDRNSPIGTSPPQSPQEPFPSLVSQLQQVHGLTKKKVYGAKPVRKPFVSGELYRGEPTNRRSLSLSPELPVSPLTNHGGRMASHSTLDRSHRLHHSPSFDMRPYQRPNRIHDPAATPYKMPTAMHNSASQYRTDGHGSVSLPSSPTPYVELTHAPIEFSQPAAWAIPKRLDTTLTTNSSPPSLSATLASPVPRQSVSLPSSVPSTPYMATHSIEDHHLQVQDPEIGDTTTHQQGHAGSAHSGAHYYNDPPIGNLSSTSTSTSGYRGSEMERDDKNPMPLSWDPNLYRDELLSHLYPNAAQYRTETQLESYSSTSSLPPPKPPHSLSDETQRRYPAQDAERAWALDSEANHHHYRAPEPSSLGSNVSPGSGSNSLTRWAG